MQQIEKLSPNSQGTLLRWMWRDGAIRTRLVLIVLLSAVLMEAINWAMDVTQTNAKRISTNIVRLQEGGDLPQTAPEKRVVPLRAGPIIEALKARPTKRH